jgi:translation initiation factor 1 (eIF-1/SUI1)
VKAGGVVAFLGPSLSPREARRIAPCTVLPPARQGDVWRALARRPAAIALVDGRFESTPSVWHHELLDALDAGVAVFGGASMGALRAVELAAHGMVGVGRIFGWYRDGAVEGDDEVALLHAGPEHGFRALTLPLVQVRHAAEAALAAGVLPRATARRLVTAAAEIPYQQRTWRTTLDAAAPLLGPATLERARAFLPGVPDLKAEDARATIAAAAAFARAVHPERSATRGRARSRDARSPFDSAPLRSGRTGATQYRPSSLVRRRKLVDGAAVVAGRDVDAGAVLAALRTSPAREALTADGLRRFLVTGLARSLGLEVTRADEVRAERAWLARLGVPPRRRAAFLAESGLDEADARRLAEDLALEEAALAWAARLVPDGPSADEGLALAARLAGAYAAAARRLALPARSARVRRAGMSKRDRDAAPEAPFHNPFGGLAGKLGMTPAPAPAAPAASAKAAPAPARAVVRLERKGRGGKEATVVEKLALPPAELERWVGELKRALGCGGVVEGDTLVLQGDLRERVKPLLERRGVRKVTLG